MSVVWEPAGLEELVASVRRLNLEALKEAIAANPGLIAEAVPCDEDGEPIGEGDFDLPCRIDLVPEDDGESVMVTPKTHLEFAPVDALVRGVPVQVHPFGWDYADFTARLAGDDTPIDALLDWFDAWFYGNEDVGIDADGLAGVVHYLSDPELEAGLLEFTVDFGSAPVEAFAALVEALASLGASEITVSSNNGALGDATQ